ncbi:MAG TPA: TonB-dependent receptor [Steroidobacteraceae bacterium]|nr:TonB-dependent receptor [Steroidobacteraceae bacterium]
MDTNQFVRRAVRAAMWTGGAFAAGLAAHAAQAQTAPTRLAAADEESTPALSEVVVTGSRIATPNLDSISPVTAVTSEEIKQTGVTRIEDLINSLPQVVADQGSGLSMGSNGTATINLRGLGAQRTLVLINGRRLNGGDPGANFGANLSFASAADINQVPVALIERVDVLTGGASSTYGADAVSGVVNFVMNDHFEGVRIDANAGIYNHNNHEGWVNPLITARGFPAVNGTNWDGANRDITAIMGHNFADGAGNFEGYLGYRRANQVTADHRDHSACQLSNSASSGGAPFVCGGSSNSAPAVFENPTAHFADQVNPDGTLGPRYARYNYAASHYLQRIDERYTAGFFGKLKFNEHVEAYSEFMFMDDKTTGAYAAAGSFLGSGKAIDANTLISDGALTYNCGSGGYGNPGMNPYITASEFGTLCPETAGGAPIAYTNAANLALPKGSRYAPYQMLPDGTGQLLVGRRNIEGGSRQDNYDHTAYRGVFGARGAINDEWTYDAYGLFSQTRSIDFHNNDTSTQRMQNALLAVNQGGTPVCQGGQSGCVPWNIFNPAQPITKQQLAYISVPGVFTATEEEEVGSGYVSGDLTKYGIKTPWADDGLKVVFGTEWRRDKLTSLPDAEYQSGDLAGIGSPTPPVDAGQHVWEAFTEERMSLAKNLPGIKTLDLETGYRYSNYSEGYKTNTYKIGLEWSPVEDVRVRGSFNRAVRAPNLQELYQPLHVGLDIGGDLCAGATKLTQAQCALLGVSPALYANGVAGSPAAQYNGEIGGNPNVKPEVGITKEIGVVFTPTFLPGFNATVDYSDIRISNLINCYGPNTIQQNCLLSDSVSSSWCQLVHRDPAGTLWASQSAYTYDQVLNEGAEEYKGIDIGLAYRFNLGSLGRIRTRLDGTWLKSLVFSPGAGKSFDCAGRFGPSCSPITPTWRHRFTADWDTPITGLSGGFTWRFFGQATNTLNDPKTPDYLAGLNPIPDARIPTISYLDLRVSYTWDKITARFGVNNVLDKDPPTIDTANSGGNQIYAESNTFPSVYDTLGRYLFLNVTVDF